MFFDSWSGYGAVGFSVDITEQKVVEEQLVELLTNNRKLAQKLVEVQENERRNLARELHDELGQSITAVKSLATIISTCSDHQYDEIKKISKSIIGLSSRLYEVVNSIMQRLRPDIIDGLDFTETLRNCIVRSQLETMGVKCDLSITGDVNDIDEVVKITIYRIIQECLTNISKHAMASNVSITLERGPLVNSDSRTVVYSHVACDKFSSSTTEKETIVITISDDGIGMNRADLLEGPSRNARHGLQGIKERVAAMGGSLKITTDPGRGMTLQAVIALGDFADNLEDAFSETELHSQDTTHYERAQTH